MKLSHALIENGLIQFGTFYDDGGKVFVRYCFDMLSSYPSLLREIAGAAQQMISDDSPDHLVCMADSVAWGIAVSLQSNVPLVYSQGSDLPPARDLIGAFDVGHPATLLAQIVTDNTPIESFSNICQRVGLDIVTVVTILDMRHDTASGAVPVRALLTKSRLEGELVQDYPAFADVLGEM